MPARAPRGSHSAVLAALAVLAVAGCGNQPQAVTSRPGLAGLLLDNPAAGFSPRTSGTGPLDLETAANATEAPVDGTRNALKASTFGGGHVKIWTSGTQYIVALVLSFDHPVDSARFVDYEVNYLKGSISASVYPDQFLPGVTDFTLNGATRTRATVFCQGTWFTVEGNAFNSYLCDTERPVGGAMASNIANAQYRKALGGLLSPAPSTSGTP